jgi:hypothetical protein
MAPARPSAGDPLELAERGERGRLQPIVSFGEGRA